MTLSMSPSAVCQCFTLVSLCTSIADPNWIQVRNSTDPEGKQLIYGVAFTLHAAQNLTDTGPLGGINGWGMWLLYVMAALCYIAVLLSSSSFLLDFLGAGMSHPRLVLSLHISTVAFLLSVLGVCGACLYVIYCNLQEDKFVLMGDWVGGWTWPRSGFRSRGRGGSAGMQLYPGESFYIAMLSLLFSCVGSVISLRGPGNPASTQREHTAVVEGDDSDTEPLIPRGHGVGQSDKDSRGEEVFPELTQGEVDTAERLSV
ncbi:uncharacterized protein LOC105015099 [Esox lucius]|uniref:uncharacterized protein LOC105015099 n=1 Tax=Esox lucius TaxID=8010 RepID=UPI000576FA7E|nr:uncharacterized protein LOC105015099 [Esox lucius]XP_010876263.1 uncharacterized protein LOC105015099 [Esox lucius]